MFSSLSLYYLAHHICIYSCKTPSICEKNSELDAHPSIQNTIGIALSLPWAFKVMYCCFSVIHLNLTNMSSPLFLPSSVMVSYPMLFPIHGERRRPYIFIGYLIGCCALLTLAGIGRPSAPILGMGLGMATVGMVMADTICDSMIVARSRQENDEDHGHLQSSCYAFRFSGSVIAAILGALVYNKDQWGWGLTFSQVLFISGVLPLAILFPLCLLKEMRSRDEPILPVKQQLKNIWSLVKLKAVWMPMVSPVRPLSFHVKR